jgi:hypothetical protein
MSLAKKRMLRPRGENSAAAAALALKPKYKDKAPENRDILKWLALRHLNLA